MSRKKKSVTGKSNKLTYEYKDLLALAKNGKLALWSEEDLIKSLNKIFLADQWLDLEKFTTEKIVEIFTRLLVEAEYNVLTSYNSYVVDDPSKEKSQFYGSNFPRLSIANLEALKICYENKDAKFLDLGSGWGSITWKALLAGCKVTAVDISFDNKKFKTGFIKNIESIVPKDVYTQNLETVSSPVVGLLNTYPEYEGEFDVVHSARVLHFHVPKYFGDFANTVYQLLKPAGKAVIITDSTPAAVKGLASYCYEYYQNHKEYGSIAPGYMDVYKVETKVKLGNLNMGGCYTRRDDKSLLDLESFPPHKYELLKDSPLYNPEVGKVVGKDAILHSYLLASFDIDSLTQIFINEDFVVLDSYYFGGKDNTNDMLAVKHTEGIEGVAIVLEKVGDIIDDEL